MRLDFRFRRVSVCQRAIRLCEAFIFYPLPTEDSLWFLARQPLIVNQMDTARVTRMPEPYTQTWQEFETAK